MKTTFKRCYLVLFSVLLFTSGCAGTLRVYGTVRNVDRLARTVTINTSMGDREVLDVSNKARISKKGTMLSLEDLSNGEDVLIYYGKEEGGKVVANKILVGRSVPHCSCGYSCTCPLSRGCRVIRY